MLTPESLAFSHTYRWVPQHTISINALLQRHALQAQRQETFAFFGIGATDLKRGILHFLSKAFAPLGLSNGLESGARGRRIRGFGIGLRFRAIGFRKKVGLLCVHSMQSYHVGMSNFRVRQGCGAVLAILALRFLLGLYAVLP